MSLLSISFLMVLLLLSLFDTFDGSVIFLLSLLLVFNNNLIDFFFLPLLPGVFLACSNVSFTLFLDFFVVICTSLSF